MASEITIVLFLAIVGLGAMIQTITGFAMGLIIMAGVTILGLADIGFAAAVVSFISLLNATLALRSGFRHVDRRFVSRILLGLVPAMVFGLVLLDYLSDHSSALLKLCLGVVVVVAGTSLMISPLPFQRTSRDSSLVVCGSLGGVLTGLYSAGGAPLAYFLYRQPVSLEVIRFSLLAVFAISTAGRAMMVAASGQLSVEIVQFSALSIPIVVLVTIVTNRFMHLIPDKIVRKIVFIVLMLMGCFLILTSALG